MGRKKRNQSLCVCEECGSDFWKIKTLVTRCDQCREKDPKKMVQPKKEFLCQNCNKPVVSARRSKFCSDICADKFAKNNPYALNNQNSDMFLRWKTLERDGFRCHYCGESPHRNPDIILHADHIIPKSKGGINALSNLITSCSKCNFSKGDSELTEENIQFLRTE